MIERLTPKDVNSGAAAPGRLLIAQIYEDRVVIIGS